jgi:hypothetical protein
MNVFKAYKVLFGIEGSDKYKVIKSKKSGLRFIRDGSIMLVEQNKNKRSVYADLARRGHNVAWLFKDGKYHAVVIDGMVSEADNPVVRDVAVAISLLTRAKTNGEFANILKSFGLMKEVHI